MPVELISTQAQKNCYFYQVHLRLNEFQSDLIKKRVPLEISFPFNKDWLYYVPFLACFLSPDM